MFKSNYKKIVIAFSIFVIALLFANTNYAQFFKFGNNDDDCWKVVITSDTKELIDTQEIKFKVQDNSNVVSGKIAPGLKVTAYIEIDISETKVPVDIKSVIDTSKVPNFFKVTSKINEEDYSMGTVKTFKPDNNNGFTKENGKIILTFDLEWINDETNNEEDTAIGINLNKISVPITLNIYQHI